MKIKIRNSILFAMIALVFFSCYTIVYISYMTGLNSVNNVLDKLVNLVSKAAIERSIDFFLPAERVLKFNIYYQKLIIEEISASLTFPNPNSDKIVQKILSYTNPQIYEKFGLTRDEIEAYLFEKVKQTKPIVDFNMKTMQQYSEFRSIEGSGYEKDFTVIIRMADETFSVKYVFPYHTRKGDFVISVWNHENPTFYSEDFRNPVSGRIADFKNNIQSVDDEEVYDPTTCSWFIGAVDSYEKAMLTDTDPEIFWSEPQVFFSDETPGVSASIPVIDENGKLVYISCINIGIIGISTGNLDGLKIGYNGRVVIFNEALEIIAYSPEPASAAAGDTADTLIHEELRFLVKQMPLFDDLADPKKVSGYNFELTPLAEARNQLYVTAYEQGSVQFAAMIKDEQISFKDTLKSKFTYNKAHYVAIYTPFPSFFQWNWILGIIVPEDEFLDNIGKNTYIMLSVSGIALVISILFAFFLSSKITKSLEHLAKEANEIRFLKLDSPVKIQTELYELDKLSTAFSNMKDGLRSFEKYVPSDLVRYLMLSGKKALLGGDLKILTVSFMDIDDFITISESMSPPVLVNALGDYLGEMSALVTRNEGTIDKYIGDGILAFWGAPKEVEEHAFLACKTALEQQERLAVARQEKCNASGTQSFMARIGITTGELIVGNIGAQNRFDYTVIGDTVNFTSRLEGLNRFYGTQILCSEFTNELIKERILTRKIDVVAVKGKNLPVGIYEIICLKENAASEMNAFVQEFEKALYCYSIHQFKTAFDLLKALYPAYKHDTPLRLLLERCRFYHKNPPADDWNGVYVHKNK